MTTPTRHPEPRRLLVPVCFAVACAILLVQGCSPQKNFWQSGMQVPGFDKPMQVERVTERGDYLAAILASKDFSIEVYLPNNEACHAVFVEGRTLDYKEGAPGGIYRHDDHVCSSAGIGTLREWRSRNPRSRAAGEVIPRRQAQYQLVYQDEDVAFLRGRFPLTPMVGFVEMGDTIAVVDQTPECDGPIARNTSTMEFYPTGKRVFTLVSTRGQCLITGLIAPFGQGRPAPPS